MTNPRTRTHKIHRKRGAKKGFKSRSQRGGFNWKFWESDQNTYNQPVTEKGFFDGFFGNNDNKPVAPVETYNQIQQPQQMQPTPIQQQQQMQTTPMQPQQQQQMQEKELNEYMGGRRKRTKCKRHHKHSRRCKK
jgi:hypothetical protein